MRRVRQGVARTISPDGRVRADPCPAAPSLPPCHCVRLPPTTATHAPPLPGVHGLDRAEAEGLVGPSHKATQTLLRALQDFLAGAGGDAPAAPPHVAVVGSSLDRWLFMVWALQRLPSRVAPELRDAAAGVRTVLLPASRLGGLPELAWALSQHPRARFVVVANGLEEEGGSSRADAIAALSGYDGFSWPPNALVLAGLAGGAGAYQELERVHGTPFEHLATIQDRFAA